MPKVQGHSGHEGGGQRRRRRGPRVSSALAEINVVPLVDVMLVMLVIFMVPAPMIAVRARFGKSRTTQKRGGPTKSVPSGSS